MKRSDGSILGVGGLRLAYRTWEPPKSRATIIVVHGLGEHSGRYREFAARMAGYGMSTFAMDLRGHGLSDGRRGHVPSFDVFLQELDRFRREVEGLADLHVPMFLLGHSLGGLIAVRYQEEYNTRFEGAIIISPWLATAMSVPRWKANAAQALSKLLPALPFSAGIRPEHVSRDPDIVEAYRADPLVHDRVTPRFFTEVSAAMGLALQRSDRIQEPLLFMAAGDDRLVDTERSLRFARSLTAPDLTVKVYPGHYHELLNELDRASIHREIRDWIAARV
ncbi:MAG TPA: lysophospholipase [Longimicrobiales bacterium]|nr:lysophospholipase [Longimicrobiales bacterium]